MWVSAPLSGGWVGRQKEIELFLHLTCLNRRNVLIALQLPVKTELLLTTSWVRYNDEHSLGGSQYLSLMHGVDFITPPSWVLKFSVLLNRHVVVSLAVVVCRGNLTTGFCVQDFLFLNG